VKSLFVKLGWFAAACALLIGTFAVVGPKAVKAAVYALIQDRDQRGRNIYQTEVSCFATTNPCVLPLPAVPAGQRLIVEHVSVIATMQAGDAPDVTELRGGTQNVYQFLPLTPVPGNFGNQSQFVTNQEVLASYNAGEVPEVDTFAPTGNTFTVLADVSGYLISIP
jgi:hypothetical protein